jgi:hypothetical protein
LTATRARFDHACGEWVVRPTRRLRRAPLLRLAGGYLHIVAHYYDRAARTHDRAAQVQEAAALYWGQRGHAAAVLRCREQAARERQLAAVARELAGGPDRRRSGEPPAGGSSRFGSRGVPGRRERRSRARLGSIADFGL